MENAYAKYWCSKRHCNGILQAIENVSILLKEMYPRMNEGALPNLNDMLKMLTKKGMITIYGKCLEIKYYDDEEIAVKGKIEKIEL